MTEKTLGQYTGYKVSAFLYDPFVQKVLASLSGGGGVWGSITGTIGDQTDLAAEFALKADAADVSNVDNTSDANKPVSTAQQAAIDLKADINSPTFTGTVGGITKAMVGLTNVDDTSDANKPVSTAQAAADAVVLAAALQLVPSSPQAIAARAYGSITLGDVTGNTTHTVGVLEINANGTSDFPNAVNSNLKLFGDAPGIYITTTIYGTSQYQVGAGFYWIGTAFGALDSHMMNYSSANGNMRMGSSSAAAHVSARLDVDSTTKGFLPPRMTEAQRDAIATPAAGLMIYNTTTNKLNVFTTTWEVITSA